MDQTNRNRVDRKTGSNVGQGDMNIRRFRLAAALVLLILAIGAIVFARAQNVWVDESTQLSGMTLTPGPLMGWLSGTLTMPFGVPADRMPPLSYLLDMPVWRLSGGGVLAMRLYHAVLVGGGILLLMLAMARRFGPRSALLAGLFLVLSPKLVDIAVEIRAYPLFLAITCAQVALLVRGEVATRPRRLALFLLLGLASAYTHFFGVVATSALFVAAFIDAPTIRTAARALAGYVLFLILCIGLLPFISGAATITNSAAPPPAPGLGAIATFIGQTLGSAVLLVNPVIAGLFFAGTGLLLLSGAIGLARLFARHGLDLRHEPAAGMALALLAGFVVVVAAAYVLSGFSTLSPRYNIWMMPPLAVLLALCADGLLTPDGKGLRLVRLGALALAGIGAVWGQAWFLSRADLFIHGPSRALEALLEQAGPNTAILHATEHWGWAGFPLSWAHGRALDQWLLSADGRSATRIRFGQPLGKPEPLSALAPYQGLLVNRVDVKTYRDLRQVESAALAPAPAAARPLAPQLAAAGWQGSEILVKPGYYALTAQLYRKRPAPNGAP